MPDPVTGIMAGTSLLGAGMASSASNKASKSAAQAQAAELDFQKERYQDWQDVFGPIQKNLGDYYSNLSPDYFEAVGIQNFEEERALAETQMNENLAQRGITDSGLAAEFEQDSALNAATSRARIRTEAPLMAAKEKMNFLQVGLGSNPAESMVGTLSRNTSRTAETAAYAGQQAQQAISSAINTTGTALGDYFGGKSGGKG